MKTRLYSGIINHIKLNAIAILLFTDTSALFYERDKKNDSPDGLLGAVSYPLDWILTIDQSVTSYK